MKAVNVNDAKEDRRYLVQVLSTTNSTGHDAFTLCSNDTVPHRMAVIHPTEAHSTRLAKSESILRYFISRDESRAAHRSFLATPRLDRPFLLIAATQQRVHLLKRLLPSLLISLPLSSFPASMSQCFFVPHSSVDPLL